MKKKQVLQYIQYVILFIIIFIIPNLFGLYQNFIYFGLITLPLLPLALRLDYVFRNNKRKYHYFLFIFPTLYLGAVKPLIDNYGINLRVDYIFTYVYLICALSVYISFLLKEKISFLYTVVSIVLTFFSMTTFGYFYYCLTLFLYFLFEVVRNFDLLFKQVNPDQSAPIESIKDFKTWKRIAVAILVVVGFIKYQDSNLNMTSFTYSTPSKYVGKVYKTKKHLGYLRNRTRYYKVDRKVFELDDTQAFHITSKGLAKKPRNGFIKKGTDFKVVGTFDYKTRNFLYIFPQKNIPFLIIEDISTGKKYEMHENYDFKKYFEYENKKVDSKLLRDVINPLVNFKKGRWNQSLQCFKKELFSFKNIEKFKKDFQLGDQIKYEKRIGLRGHEACVEMQFRNIESLATYMLNISKWNRNGFIHESVTTYGILTFQEKEEIIRDKESKLREAKRKKDYIEKEKRVKARSNKYAYRNHSFYDINSRKSFTTVVCHSDVPPDESYIYVNGKKYGKFVKRFYSWEESEEREKSPGYYSCESLKENKYHKIYLPEGEIVLEVRSKKGKSFTKKVDISSGINRLVISFKDEEIKHIR